MIPENANVLDAVRSARRDLGMVDRTVKIKKLHPSAILPTYAHDGDAGMDMRALLGALLEPSAAENGRYLPLRIWPGETVMGPTGVAMEIRPGYFGSARERSGLAAKGLRLGGGVIDSGYRGEVKGILTNVSRTAIDINHGDRIFQIIIQPCERAELLEVEEFSESARGAAGFGSTGV